MIIRAEIINQPLSGEYEERIYDIPSPWNSPNWTWVKFLNEDSTEWCGEFRGIARGIAISQKHNNILILTSDYLFQLDCSTGQLVNYESQTQYQNLTVTPLGDFIVSDYYHIEVIGQTLEVEAQVESPIEMDMIKFHGWENGMLLISCDEFLNWENHLELELDGETLDINIKNFT
jgi:hypothetical protein